MVSRTKKASKSSTLDESSEHSSQHTRSSFHLEANLSRKNSNKSLMGNNNTTADDLDSKDFCAFRNQNNSSKTKKKTNKKKNKKKQEVESDSDSDSAFGGDHGGLSSSSASSSSSSSSDSSDSSDDSDDDGGFSVVSHQSNTSSFRLNGSGGTPLTSTNAYAPATGRLRAAAMNRRGSTSLVSKSEITITEAPVFPKGVLNRRGSTSMIPKIDNSSSHGGSNRSLTMLHKKTTKKKEASSNSTASVTSASVNSASLESAPEKEHTNKNKKQRDALERSHSKRMGDKSMSTTSLNSKTSLKSSSNKKKSSTTTNTKKKKEDIPEDTPATDDLDVQDKIQAKFLEARRKERQVRLEAAKERIRLQKEEEEQAAKKKKKNRAHHHDTDNDHDQHNDDHDNSTAPKSPRKKNTKSSSSRTLLTAVHQPPPEERLKMAYRWYMRLGMPNQEKLKERIRKMGTSCEITVHDVDLLPWIADGRRVNVKHMLMSSI